MSKRAVHMFEIRCTSSAYGWTKCGRYAGTHYIDSADFTRKWKEVTCKQCLKMKAVQTPISVTMKSENQ
jgi:hypothetical protein